MKSISAFILSLLLCQGLLTGQEGWDDRTRALYILDIARYVEYDDEIGTAYCIAFEDIDGNAYYTFVFTYEGEWKTEGVTRIGIATCDFIESN